MNAEQQKKFEDAWEASPLSHDPYRQADWKNIYRQGWIDCNGKQLELEDRIRELENKMEQMFPTIR